MWSDCSEKTLFPSKLNVSLSLSLSVGQVRVKEVYEEDDCWYLVQELVAGGRVFNQ